MQVSASQGSVDLPTNIMVRCLVNSYSYSHRCPGDTTCCQRATAPVPTRTSARPRPRAASVKTTAPAQRALLMQPVMDALRLEPAQDPTMAAAQLVQQMTKGLVVPSKVATVCSRAAVFTMTSQPACLWFHLAGAAALTAMTKCTTTSAGGTLSYW
jgi:hypothetical protein